MSVQTSMPAGGVGEPPLTRRERQRLATYEEIASTARRLLRSEQEVSVRAVAGAMGLTPPALYRYVDGYAGLLELLVRQIFGDVVTAMGVARDGYPADDPAARIVASATAFRRWALAHPPEFRLVFATPPGAGADVRTVTGDLPGRAPAGCATAPPGSELFSDFFGELFMALWLERRFPLPTTAQLEEPFLELCRACPEEAQERQLLEAMGDLGPGLVWVFKLCWVRLYGIVALEVFGHVEEALIRDGTLYTAIMLDNGQALGIADEWDRLRAIAREVSGA